MTLRPTIDTAIRASKASALKKKERKGKKGKNGAQDGAEDEDEEAFDESQTTTKSGKVKDKPTPKESIDPYVPPPRQPGGPPRATEFEEASQRRNVADVVQAPPTLSVPGRRGKKAVVGVNEPLPASRMPVSAAIKAMMEQERERAVAAYRQLKEQREQERKEQQP